MTDVLLDKVVLGSHAGGAQGSLKLTPAGVQWRPAHGGNVLTLRKDDIDSVELTQVPGALTLELRTSAGKSFSFAGLSAGAAAGTKAVFEAMGKKPAEGSMAISGRNWGQLDLAGSSLVFRVEGKRAFGVGLGEVSGVQMVGKTDVMMEFPVEEAEVEGDALVEMALYVPEGAEGFGRRAVVQNGDASASAAADGNAEGAGNDKVEVLEVHPAADLMERIRGLAGIDSGSSGDAVATVEDVSLVVPRGKFHLELHLTMLKLVGQSQDFIVRYSSIVRLIVMPRQASPHMLVAINLDPPIRKGNTYYPHILIQFNAAEELDIEEINITDEQFQQKKEKAKGRLERSYSGLAYEVFSKLLRGLSGTKLIEAGREGSFRSTDGGCAVRCSYKADDGYLYPLDRAFFFVVKPAILIPFEEVRGVEFGRDGQGALMNSKTFDVKVRTSSDAVHVFRGIARTDWDPLLTFLREKKIPIDNLGEALQGPAGARAALDDGFDHLAAFVGSSDDEDEDFEVKSADEAEAADVSDVSDGDVGGDDGAEEKPRKKEKKAKKEKKEKKEKKKKSKRDEDGHDSDGSHEKGKRRKRSRKGDDAPQKPLSAFMCFSEEMRRKIEEENPDMPTGEVIRKVGELWKSTTAEERNVFEEMAAKDRERYEREMEEYERRQAGDMMIKDAGGAVGKEEPAQAGEEEKPSQGA